MIKKLLTLKFLCITLSLIFVSFSCSSDNEEAELLEEIVNYDGYYVATAEGSIINLSFEEENKINLLIDNGSTRWNSVYKVSEIIPTDSINEYKVKIDIISEKITPLDNEGVKALKEDFNLDWSINITKDVTDLLPTEEKTEVLIISVSNNKNTIIKAFASDPQEKITLTYHQ